MQNYQLAADYYKGENSISASNTCLLKVAQFASELEVSYPIYIRYLFCNILTTCADPAYAKRYNVAIETFETVATQSIDNNLLKWNVKDYYFKALLCHLCSSVRLFLHPPSLAVLSLSPFLSHPPSSLFLLSSSCRI